MERGFDFGENWTRFLHTLDHQRIQAAKRSLQATLDVDDLAGKTFLDVGSGSGLFSLAARQLGANVRSFDYDPKSVACTNRLRDIYFPGDENWVVEEASALDVDYLRRLNSFDVVYSWGVLHHTGQMWTALGNVASLVAPGGWLCIAIYNDQGWASRAWLAIKRLYNEGPAMMRPLLLGLCAIRLWGPTMLRDALRLRPLHTWRTYRKDRGMSPWHDIIDWVGGYPFQVAKPEDIIAFCRPFHLELQKSKTCGRGHGCNEFVFRKGLGIGD